MSTGNLCVDQHQSLFHGSYFTATHSHTMQSTVDTLTSYFIEHAVRVRVQPYLYWHVTYKQQYVLCSAVISHSMVIVTCSVPIHNF